jgi:hypothetical protein
MKRLLSLLSVVLCLNVLTLNAANSAIDVQPLSPKSYVALYTCDPGKELYATFGHTAIGVIDPVQNLWVVFNYGTFDFNVPHFYLKFASGKLLYKISAGNYYKFLVEYEIEQRRVVEQQLNMSLSQRQRLLDLLIENYKPENREYQYDFFFDNCASRILDMLYLTLGDTLVYKVDSVFTQPTFRGLITPYLKNSKWSKFGIDLALGSVIDKPATPRQQSFLPDLLNQYLDNCQINGQPFVKSEKDLVPASELPKGVPFWFSPWFICWILFTIVLILTYFIKTEKWFLADRIIFTTFGLLGLIVLLLWFATDHDATAGNLNVLWANPLFLVYVFMMSKPRTRVKIVLQYLLLIPLLAVVIGWHWVPQQYNPAFIPLAGIALVRFLAGEERFRINR